MFTEGDLDVESSVGLTSYMKSYQSLNKERIHAWIPIYFCYWPTNFVLTFSSGEAHELWMSFYSKSNLLWHFISRKIKASYSMTANTFGVPINTVSTIVCKVCATITQVMGSQYIKLPQSDIEIDDLERNWNTEPILLLCSPLKIHMTITVIDIEVKWPESVYYGKVFAN